MDKKVFSKSTFTPHFIQSFDFMTASSSLPRNTTLFIWTLAILLAIILFALFNQYIDRSGTIAKSQLLRTTRQVTVNLELEMNSINGTLQSAATILAKDGIESEVFDPVSRDILKKFPEVLTVRILLPTGKSVHSATQPHLRNSIVEKFNYLEYPQNLRDAIVESFVNKRQSISSYWTQAGSPNKYVGIIYPFTSKDGGELALFIRVSLNSLLEQSIPVNQNKDFEFSLVHGNTVIAGNAAYHSPGDESILSTVMPAYPLPSTIQIYGAQILETPLIFSDPFLFWTSLLFAALFISLIFISRKISSLKKQLVTLSKRDERFKEIEGSLPLGLLVTDLDYRIQFVNHTTENLMGYSEEELINKPQPWSFLGGTTIPKVAINRIYSQSIFPIRLDIKIHRKDETETPTSVLLSPFYDKNETQTGWIFVLRDNTPEANAQYLINDALATYQKLLNSVSACISVVQHSPSGSILSIRNLPYTQELGHSIDGHLAISKAFSTPFNAQGIRNELVWVDSLSRWFNATEIRMTLSGGALVTMQTAQDVTTTKIQEESLEQQANRMEASARLISLGEMASSVTHEINQPLTAISTYSSTALELIEKNPEIITLEKVVEVFTKINTQAKRIERIIKNIRNFSQKKRASMVIVSVNTIVADTVELAQLIEKKSRVTIIYEIDRTLPDVECDPLQIVQVLLNLIRNAADSLSENNVGDNRIWFVIHKLPDQDVIRFEVADHGVGIPDSLKESLFTPFFTTKKDGLGLGLPICRSIIEAHSSRLMVEDNQPTGAKFHFELKIAHRKEEESSQNSKTN